MIIIDKYKILILKKKKKWLQSNVENINYDNNETCDE